MCPASESLSPTKKLRGSGQLQKHNLKVLCAGKREERENNA